MVARATAPNRIGPGSVFPDASKWDFSKGLEGSPMASGPFWIAMICQIIIVVGYLWFYRKEQLGECLQTLNQHHSDRSVAQLVPNSSLLHYFLAWTFCERRTFLCSVYVM
jgi:hypothetical protein